ncbi:MAG: SpoIIE family protein phosphatase [Bacteroidales bacterium]|nr:SpoIIE family protein phosphatase [Bacteroidales bacterium]
MKRNKLDMKSCLICILLCMCVGIGFSQVTGEASDHIKLGDQNMNAGNKAEAATHYNKAAYLLRKSNKKNEAITYYEMVLKINAELDNSNGVILTRDNLSMLYTETEQYEKAIAYLKKNLGHYKSKGNSKQVISIESNIADSYRELKNYDEAIALILGSIEKSKELSDLKLLKRCYGIAYEIYDAKGDSDNSRKYFELYAAIDKKIKENRMVEIQETAEKEVTEAQTAKAQTEEKLAETVTTLQKVEELTQEQKLQLEVNDLKIKEQDALLKVEQQQKIFFKRIFYIVAIFSAALLFLITVLVRLINRLKRAKEEISSQKVKLERQHKEIKASIRYANTIQTAILPSMKEIHQYFDAFIIYMPKDIVSGDFYWFSKQETQYGESWFISVIDCTGHGVPGAFMSMIGSQILNEIVNEKGIYEPEKILEQLHDGIHLALRQNETDNNDGMDLGLCRIEKNANKYNVTFAGAKRPLYYCKDNQPIENLKADRRSIGGYKAHRQKNKFESKTIELSSNDRLYIFSDGITDQNNGQRKKYGRQRLEALLDKFEGDSLEAQEQKILNDYNAFVDLQEQRDDITILGIKLR